MHRKRDGPGGNRCTRRSDSLTLMARSLVLDGEMVCLDERGHCQFNDLLFRRGEPTLVALDLLFATAKTCVARAKVSSLSAPGLDGAATGPFVHSRPEMQGRTRPSC